MSAATVLRRRGLHSGDNVRLRHGRIRFCVAQAVASASAAAAQPRHRKLISSFVMWFVNPYLCLLIAAMGHAEIEAVQFGDKQ